ncbi:hypothetical protein AYL99_06112 [Fonsecaea erecta]|uniref:Uncharacterized protein n=1 Tax=Fonsecaea erecta TaxID=1367422 RepID=A0A178ZIF8_9EURO|nr:hypothetical protein AYL99_06112 [Fonsecaea erecta]OAP58815.1 hypothetical protein AYL99_06112 [Fonsecaea erecta]
MAPRRQPTTTPTRIMTRPSAGRRTPAVPPPTAASTALPATQAATGKAASSKAPRRKTTKSAPKPATTSAQSGRTPAKSTSKAKPQGTPAKKTPAQVKRTKAVPKASEKDDKDAEDSEDEEDEEPETLPDSNRTSAIAENSKTSQLPESDSEPSVSNTQPVTPTPGRKNAKAKKGKRKSLPFEELAYINTDSSEDEFIDISTKEAVPTSASKGKRRAVDEEASIKVEETDPQPADPPTNTSTRKRKIRPFDDQAYRFEEEDSEHDDGEELDDNVPGDLPPNWPRRIHLKVSRDQHEKQMRQLAGIRARESSTSSCSSSGSGSSSGSRLSSGPRLSTSPTRPAASQGPPRAVSPRSSGSPAKRQRTASPPVASPSQPRDRTPQISTVDPNDALVLAEQLFVDVEKSPRALGLDEIGVLFMILQEKLSRFCSDHFDFELTAEQENAWPMHLLATKYLSLMLMTQRIADGSGHGWKNFFTKREHRRHLVHGVIGEWFQQRIFKHTAFSIPDAKVRKLEDIDHKYLHYDAFVRNKKKAECLEELKIAEDYFPSQDFPHNYEHLDNLEIAARRMANNLLTVLEPLLPPPFFDPIKPRWRQSSRLREEGAEMRFQIWRKLVELIRMAGSLHLCIRFAGVNGLVVRIAPHVPKGTRLSREDAEENICVNAGSLNAEIDRPPNANDQLQVRMTCFGRVEAVVPTGLDVLELGHAQESARAAGKELTREEAEQQLFNLYPYDLQETDAAREAVADLPPIPGTEWSTAILKTSIQEARGKGHGRRPREDETSDQASPKSGAFVTVYSRVAPSNLYCEWVSSSDEQQLRPTADADPQSHRQTLAEVVAEARREKYISCSLEDAASAVWNTVSRREFLEWLVFSGSIAGVSALTAPWIRDTVESFNLAERSRDVGTSIQLHAARALSTAANWRSALQHASAYLSQLVAPTASTVTVTSVVTDWTTITLQASESSTGAGEPMEEVSPGSAAISSFPSSEEYLPEALRGLTDLSRRTISPNDQDYAMVASLFSEQMGFVVEGSTSGTQASPEPELTPAPRTSRSKVL